jgi:hypothetical protein
LDKFHKNAEKGKVEESYNGSLDATGKIRIYGIVQ